METQVHIFFLVCGFGLPIVPNYGGASQKGINIFVGGCVFQVTSEEAKGYQIALIFFAPEEVCSLICLFYHMRLGPVGTVLF